MASLYCGVVHFLLIDKRKVLCLVIGIVAFARGQMYDGG